MSELAALLARLKSLEAAAEIRFVVTRYFELCDRLDATTPMEELGELFAEDAVWQGVGARYGAAFGAHVGRKAIIGMLGAYRTTPPHFALNAHFLCSERLKVDVEVAEGQWMMLQTSTYANGDSELRGARLRIGFTARVECWRIARFETENIFARPISAWDVAAPLVSSSEPFNRGA